jgi:hypothetical protein
LNANLAVVASVIEKQSGMDKWLSRGAHNAEIVGSNPTPAILIRLLRRIWRIMSRVAFTRNETRGEMHLGSQENRIPLMPPREAIQKEAKAHRGAEIQATEEWVA